MPLVSHTVARSFGVTDLPRDPWCYLYDMMKEEWVWIGRPASPREVMNKFSSP